MNQSKSLQGDSKRTNVFTGILERAVPENMQTASPFQLSQSCERYKILPD